MASSWPERIGWIASTYEEGNLRGLGRQIGVTGQAVSAWTRGEARPASEALSALARTYPQLNCRWLLTGEGRPLRDGLARGADGLAGRGDGLAERANGLDGRADGSAGRGDGLAGRTDGSS